MVISRRVSRWRRTAAAAVLVVTASAGCTVHATDPSNTGAAPSPTFVAGASSLRDPFTPGAGNGGYDVRDYHLDLRYDPASDKLSGVATIKAVATENLSRFNLDLRGLAVTAVTVGGAPASPDTTGTELQVTPSTGLVSGQEFVTTVTYSGVPTGNEGGEGFAATAEGAIAMGEPDSASSWFPVNDHPRDKATYTIVITVPDGLTALSNGVRTTKASTAGWTSSTWVMNQPMAPYLAELVIGDYRVKESTHDGRPVVTAVHQSLPTRIDAIMARSPEVVDFLQSQFGPYPFEAIGGIVIADRDVRFALENQSRPIYGPTFFDAGRGDDPIGVVVHELAHQWFGDSVSLHDWKELWLNEGFATFAAWLWFEKKGGASVQNVFDQWYGAPDDGIWSDPPGNPPASDLFSQSVYVRGGLTLQALRKTVGDATFFRIVQTWAAEQAGRSVKTADFIATAERVSSRDLTAFFQDWLYGSSRPPRP